MANGELFIAKAQLEFMYGEKEIGGRKLTRVMKNQECGIAILTEDFISIQGPGTNTTFGLEIKLSLNEFESFSHSMSN